MILSLKPMRRALPPIAAALILASCATTPWTPTQDRPATADTPVTAAACGAFRRMTYAPGLWPPETAIGAARAALSGEAATCQAQECAPVLARLRAALGDTQKTRDQVAGHNAAGRAICADWDAAKPRTE